MSILAAGNLITKLSFNLQPRLVSLPWLKRSGVRCFSHNGNDSGFPIRYIPKKHPDDKPKQSSTSGDNSPKSGMPISSDSNTRGHATIPGFAKLAGGSTIVGSKRSKMRLQKSSTSLAIEAKNELNQESSYGEGIMDSEHMKASEKVGQVVEGLQIYDMSGQGQRHKWGRQISYCNEILDSEDVKVPGEVVRELQVFNEVDQGQLCKLNRKSSYHNGVIDTEYMNAPKEVIEEMQIYNGGGQGDLGRSKACRTKQGAEKLAIELLAKRAFTAVELQKKLTSKHFPVNVVQAVIHDFRSRGLINDSLYAETYSQSRWASSSWGPRRIKQALLKKGVSQVDVEKAVKLVFEDGEDVGRKSNTRLSDSSVEQLYVQVSKQWQRSQNAPHETRKARVIRWLQYRGFDWGVVSIILKKLESEHHS